MSEPAYLYFVQHGNEDLHKIGVAANVGARLVELQCGNPVRLKLVQTHRFKKRSDAFSTERGMHSYFEDDRVIGEWFKATHYDLKQGLFNVLFDTPLAVEFPEP